VPPLRMTFSRINRPAAYFAVVVLLTLPIAAGAQSLSGSWGSMDKQVKEAARHEFTYIQSPAQLTRFVDSGYLVPLSGDRHYFLKEVSYPYARPAVRDMIELLAVDYYGACNEQLVVTSLTRP
jgi:hypothetical protein